MSMLSAKYKVKNLKLADEGKLKIEWAKAHMPVLSRIAVSYTHLTLPTTERV